MRYASCMRISEIKEGVLYIDKHASNVVAVADIKQRVAQKWTAITSSYSLRLEKGSDFLVLVSKSGAYPSEEAQTALLKTAAWVKSLNIDIDDAKQVNKLYDNLINDHACYFEVWRASKFENERDKHYAQMKVEQEERNRVKEFEASEKERVTNMLSSTAGLLAIDIQPTEVDATKGTVTLSIDDVNIMLERIKMLASTQPLFEGTL